MGYIYLITNKIDGKKYVGQSLEKDIFERWKGHLKSSSNCRYLKHALKKYGKDNFKFEIICICFDKDCDKYEQEYMNKFNTLSPNGYNLRYAGNNGLHNEETKKKISNTMSLNYSKLTDEEKKKYSEKYSETLRENSIKKRKKVNCYTLENKFIKTYNSIADARINTGSTNISLCCNNIYKTSGGFIWKFL